MTVWATSEPSTQSMARTGGARRLLLLLVGASATFRDLQVGGFHIFTVLVVVAAMFAAHRPATQRSALNVASLTLLGSALIALTVFTGDYVGYPLLAGQLMALAVSACLLGLTSTTSEMRLVMRGFLLLVTASSLWALLQQFGLVDTAMYVDYSGLERPTGFVHEPDWVAGFAVAGIAVLLGRAWNRTPWWWLAIIVNVSATVVCLARGSWLALLMVVLVALAAPRQRRTSVALSRIRVTGIAAVLATTVATAPWEYAATARIRLLSIFLQEHRDDNTQFRQGQIESLLELIRTAPWAGHGISAQGRVRITGGLTNESAGGGVATNWLLGLLADAGALALPLIIVLLVAVWRHRRGPEGLMLLAVLVTSLFSNFFFVPLTWLALAACIAARNNREAHLSTVREQVEDAISASTRSDPRRLPTPGAGQRPRS